ncbi:MAG TPA: carboxylesterase family protein [Acidobacteriaceae bacterium]|nr:carboxylesterase family protein [Acidobacteriaceae bacterium]
MNPRSKAAAFRLPLAVLLAFVPALTAQSPAPIQIDTGKLQGILTPDQKVIAYKGIPYAAPPTGDLRWRPPQAAQKWPGTFAATDFGHHCIQFASYPDMVFRDPGPSEDCLTLNIWAPATATAQTKLPVMVWIYGGGLVSGGTSEARQDGQFLAQRGVIVVSMNYRLGIFGFFTHPELAAESPAHTSGNYGLMDQAAALAWVHRNIAAFGGDPANVTLFGQSAGSESVSLQMASPLSIGLSAHAIGQSGSEFPRPGRILLPHAESEQANAAWAKLTFADNTLAHLRTLTTGDITYALHTHHTPNFGVVVDHLFLPDTLVNLYAQGKQAHIPLLAGWMANEGRMDPPPTAASTLTQVHAAFGPKADEFLTLYPAATDAQAATSANDFASDSSMGFPTWTWIEAQTHTGHAPVYRYFFTLANPGDRNHSPALGAFHSDDIEYVFGTLDSRPDMKIRPEDRTLSDQIQQYWTNFAKTGNPNLSTNATPKHTTAAPQNSVLSNTPATLPNWPTYTPATNFQVMHLDAPPIPQPDPHRNRYLFLTPLWNPPTPAPTPTPVSALTPAPPPAK